MRVLVTWGSKRGGTEGIARAIAEALDQAGFEVGLAPADQVRGVDGADAVVVGGALYANRWQRDARRFVSTHAAELSRMPTWLFSSGPLGDSANEQEPPPTAQVRRLMELIGARGHRTFGGRLTPDAQGFIASKMAKSTAGDWRDPLAIRAWAIEIAAELIRAQPGEQQPPAPPGP